MPQIRPILVVYPFCLKMNSLNINYIIKIMEIVLYENSKLQDDV